MATRILRARMPAQDALEYGLLIATIAVIVLLGTMAFGNIVGPWFNALAARVTTL